MNQQFRVFLSLVIVTGFFLFLLFTFMSRLADTLYVNGIIYTMDSQNTVGDAIAVRGDRIVGVGAAGALERKFRPKKVIDLGGKTVLPGFIDAHAHLMSLGVARLTVNLLGAASEREAAERVRERLSSTQPGQWIRGRGWDQNLWPRKRFPTTAELDRVAPNNPVYLSRVDGHAAWVNKKSLELAEITKSTPDPPGGKIIRDGAGNPTGVFIDRAMGLVSSILPQISEAESEEALGLAMRECLSYGLTGIHDMGVDTNDIQLYKRQIDAKKFPMRVYAAIGGPGETWEQFLKSGSLMSYGDHRLTVRAIKMYVDGALGSRGAALIEAYSDDPDNRGLTVISEEKLKQVVETALDHGFQVCTHAIGDRGNNIVLNVYENALKSRPKKDVRLRVEHVQVLQQSDIPRFAELGVLPSMQPTHCTSDMYWVEARLGPKRVRGAYAWRSLLKTGVIIPGGSDFPVEHPNPLFGIYAAVTRQDQQGRPKNAEDVKKYWQLSKEGIVDPSVFEGGWYASEKMERLEALRAFTSWAATAAFQEALVGSLEPGKLADFVVLSHDIVRIPAEDILKTIVERTIVGGVEVYTRDGRVTR